MRAGTAAAVVGYSSVAPLALAAGETVGYLKMQCGVNFFILDSTRVLAQAPKVLGPKHISNPDFAPF